MRRLLIAGIGGVLATFALFAAAANLIGGPHGADVPLLETALSVAWSEPSQSEGFAPEQTGPIDSAYCDGLREQSESLLPYARACRSDRDCFHYPCSCTALGTNPETDVYLELDEVLSRECGDPIMFAYCGSTRPVCEDGVCTVAQDLGQPEIPTFEPFAPEIVKVNPFLVEPETPDIPPSS